MSASDSEDKNQPRSNLPVPDVLLTVSNEIRMLSDSAADLQNLISNLVVAGAFGGSQSIYELQSLDRLCQNLGAVADFLHGLAGSASTEWKVDVVRACEAVNLSDLSERLTGRANETCEQSGEFEDFESWPLTG